MITRLLKNSHIQSNFKKNKSEDIFRNKYTMTRDGNGTPLQYSCLENPMDGGAWWAAVHGIAGSRTRLSDFTFTFPFMHWRRKWQPTPVFLPGESQGWGSLVGCPSMGSHRVGRDWRALAAAVAVYTMTDYSLYKRTNAREKNFA